MSYNDAMKYVSTRELRNWPGLVREMSADDELVLTSNGRPVAILIGVGADDLEETALAIRQVRAQRAVSRIRRRAAVAGTSRMPAKQVQAEIKAARAQRRRA